jgi:cyclopropane fatty-acyl-phospholipid synthase-like methyltransferase
LAARFWRAAGATMADKDTQLVRDLLGLTPGASVLDVPCGDGRLTLGLAALGYTTIGIDIVPDEIEFARRAGADADAGARFVVGDLRALPDVGPVDAVVSWGNSFGYLTPADTTRSLNGMHRALRPGGRLILESLTVAESLLTAGIKPSAEYEFGGIRMTTHNRYRATESRMETDLVFTDADGRVEHARAAHHVHTTGEVVRLLLGAGFTDVALMGADGTSDYELGSSRLIVLATA